MQLIKLRNKGKLRFPSSSAQNAAQPTSSGLRECLSSGRCGSAGTAVTVEHLFWKTAILRGNFRKNGKVKLVSSCLEGSK